MALTKHLLASLIAVFVAAAASGAAESDDFKLLEVGGNHVKWGTPQHGTGATITYAVALQSSSAHGTVNCRKTTGISGLLQRSKIAQADFEAALSAALRLWSEVADVHFVEAKPGATADIVVTAESNPDGIAYSDVTATSTTSAEFAPITQSLICLNPEVTWSAPPSNAVGSYRLYYVLAHEIGHTIGLDHPSPSGEVMSFEYSPTLRTLQSGDVAGAVLLYGKSQHTRLARRAEHF